ncbi:transcription antitermination factor NusB [Pseudactinotalea sp. HY160]|uniref:transcription antitermination factor NusB n=1 Tax=Pseudactinotalea sp. HY160 TaxID=2654490 RepID=UPI001310662E|nr:transcription antitermination factor NusB [Pseudactinotalea sp. HY160]
MAARTKARKRAIDLIFEADQRVVTSRQPENPTGRRDDEPEPEPTPGRHLDEVIVEVLRERIVEPGRETGLPEYSVEIAQGVSAHLARIDEEISTYSHGWTLERMPAVDRAILRVGAWELLYNDEVPDAVAIDEAVALAGDLSTDESPGFVNGLLGRILQLKA